MQRPLLLAVGLLIAFTTPSAADAAPRDDAAAEGSAIESQGLTGRGAPALALSAGRVHEGVHAGPGSPGVSHATVHLSQGLHHPAPSVSRPRMLPAVLAAGRPGPIARSSRGPTCPGAKKVRLSSRQVQRLNRGYVRGAWGVGESTPLGLRGRSGRGYSWAGYTSCLGKAVTTKGRTIRVGNNVPLFLYGEERVRSLEMRYMPRGRRTPKWDPARATCARPRLAYYVPGIYQQSFGPENTAGDKFAARFTREYVDGNPRLSWRPRPMWATCRVVIGLQNRSPRVFTSQNGRYLIDTDVDSVEYAYIEYRRRR